MTAPPRLENVAECQDKRKGQKRRNTSRVTVAEDRLDFGNVTQTKSAFFSVLAVMDKIEEEEEEDRVGSRSAVDKIEI